MFSVAGNPLLGDYGRREPQPKAHWQSGEVVQFDPAMRLGAMQKKCDRDIGEVSSYDHEQNRLPPSRCPAAKIRHYLLRLSKSWLRPQFTRATSLTKRTHPFFANR